MITLKRPPFSLRPLASVTFGSMLAATLITPPVQAQEGGIQEITVTAQFREQDLQTTPLSITAVSGEMIEARGQLKISEVADQAPNVLLKASPAGRENSMSAFIRGVGQVDQSPAVDPGVGIYIDDVYFATLSGSALDLVDVDRVEILRGPQGTLAGMNSMGGAVKLFSRKPDGNGQSYVEGAYGSLNRTDITAAGEFTIIPERLFARISGASRHRDGHVKRIDYACSHPDDPYVISGAIPRNNYGSDCQVGTLGGVAVSALRGAFRWLATDNVEVNVVVDTTHDRSESQAAVLRNADEFVPGASLEYQGVPYDNRFTPYGPNRGDTTINDPYVTYANFLSPGVTATPIDTAWTPGAPNGPFAVRPVNEMDGWGFSSNVDWHISDTMSLKSITGYRQYDTLSGQDLDGSPAVILMSHGIFEHEQFSQEFRLSGTLMNDRVDYTVGSIFFEQETVYETRIYSPYNAALGSATLKTFDFIQDDTTETSSLAFFAHASWLLTDQLTLSAGLRWTEQDKDYTFNRLNVDGQTPFLPLSNPSNPLNGTVGNFKDDIVDYRLNLAYQLTPDVMLYGQYATGFKGGGISPRPYFPQQVLGFGTEEVDAYELGLKSRFWENRAEVNFAAFYNDYQDYQAMVVECIGADGNLLPPEFRTPCGQYGNVADAEVMGAEIEVQLYPVDGMQINGSLSYIDFEFGEPFIQTNSVVAGASAPGIGDVQASLGGQYRYDLSGRGGSITPRFDVVYTPGYCGNLECSELARNESYTVVNARVGYESFDGQWRVSLEARNLADKIYSPNVFVTPIGYASHHIAPGRQWTLFARHNF